MAFQKSILAGVDGLIEKWCGLTDPSRFGTTDEPRYGSIQAAKDLSKNGGPLASAVDADAPKLLQEILDLIAKNHDSTGSGQATPVVWKLRKVPSLDAKNESAEKVLEKLVVMLLGPEWSNQVAVASGYIPGAVSDKKRAIDLVHDCGNGEFEFIELKYGDATQRYGSNTPLYAAWEIVLYGLLYAHARKQTARSDASPLLQAKKIHLMVLAPKGYYAAFNLEWLEQAINKGLQSLPLEGVKFTFAFQRFTEKFEKIYNHPQPLPAAIQAFRQADLRDREPVYGSSQTA